MDELLMCSVCIERYSENQRHPVLLPRCGHSFCRSCVSMLISGGCIVCPTCRTDQRIESAEKLPTEYTLLAIIHAQDDTKKETCDKHSVKLSFWCQSCSMATCGECLFEDHPTHSHNVMRAAKYISDMKQHAQEVAVKFIEALDEREQKFYKTIFSSTRKISNALQNVNVLRKDMEEARELMKGIREEESIRAATSLSEASKFLGLKWNIQDVNFMRKEIEEKMKEKVEKDEIDIEKEKAAKEYEAKLEKEKAEAAAKEEEENKIKEKESKRTLRKSKTLSNVDLLSGTEKVKEEKDKTKINDKEKIKNEFKLSDIKEGKLNVNLPENKTEIKSVDSKILEERKIPEDPKIKPDHKDDSKNINSDPKDLEAEYKPEKVPDLTIVKPKGKFTIKRQMKKLEPNIPEEKITKTNEKSIDLQLTESTEEKTLDVHLETTPVICDSPTVKLDDIKEPIVILPELEEKKDETITNNSFPSEPNNVTESKNISEPSEEDVDKELKLSECIQIPGFMVCVESQDGRLAEMEWGPQGLHVHCLQFSHVNYDVVISSVMLHTLIPSKAPIVFLEVSSEQTIIGKVYIKLWGHLRRANNFLSLCLGDQGKSYLNTKFLQVYNVNSSGERILGGDYEYNNGRGGCGLLSDLEWNGDYAMPMKAGMITAAGSGQSATNSLFLLCTQSDSSRNFSCPFGVVCEGLKIVKDAVQQTATKQVWISDCGVLIVPPKI